MNYYNEHDPKAAAWLRELVKAGHIADGVVDDRDIQLVQPDDLKGFKQCHFFAGIGGWSYALRLAGWPDDQPVWTGSCPCQPFSSAGKRKGQADKRHLWPEFRRLITQCRPAIVFGEQVAARFGREWLAGVRIDLETLGYAVGAADLCASCVGAPHIRQRLYWVADAENSDGRSGVGGAEAGIGKNAEWRGRLAGGALSLLADAGASRRGGPFSEPEGDSRDETRLRLPGADGGPGKLGDASRNGWEQSTSRPSQQEPYTGGPVQNFWSNYTLIPCRDGKARRIEPGSFPLAHGIPGRVGLLRGYGNAIVPQVAATFIQACLHIQSR